MPRVAIPLRGLDFRVSAAKHHINFFAHRRPVPNNRREHDLSNRTCICGLGFRGLGFRGLGFRVCSGVMSGL